MSVNENMNKYSILGVMFAMVFCYAVDACPVINIGHSPSSDAGQQTTITTIIQEDQIKDIFENVSKVLLDSEETRFMKFLQVNDIAALPADCQDIQTMGYTTSGVYKIYLKGSVEGFPVMCDMETDNGGWTVIQRRVNGSVDFFRTWNEYQSGFGEIGHEYWFGNQQIHIMTSNAWYELRIDMTGPEGDKKYVKYNVFEISDAKSGYVLFADGFIGEEGMKDDLANSKHIGQKFSTRDRDQDSGTRNCATSYYGGWWYGDCHNVNLNGLYGKGRATGIHWYSWTTYSKSMRFVEMKIRRYQKI